MTDFLTTPAPTGITVRCSDCPGKPVLPTRCEIDIRRCVRCQGKRRWLPVPHPLDHLCRWCRSECPGCGAPSPAGSDMPGELCLSCSGRCRLCSEPVPERPAMEPVVIPPKPQRPGSRDRANKWPRILLPAPALADLCDACRARGSRDPVQTVLKALPEPVVRACHGRLPAFLLEAIRAELAHRSPAQLADRVERRWWNYWSNQPLRQDPTPRTPGHSPEHVAYWLISPTDCPVRCEDGFQPLDPAVPCATCHPAPSPAPSPAAAASDHSAAFAASIRTQLQSRPGRNPRPSRRAPRTSEQVAAFDRAIEQARLQQEAADRTREEPPSNQEQRDLRNSAILQRRQDGYDPVHAAALARARAERGN
ncbi:hypothetical protein GCM10009731_04590 [Streptomyces globosus]